MTAVARAWAYRGRSPSPSPSPGRLRVTGHLDCCHRRYRRFHRYRRQNDPISCPMSRYRVVGVTRYRVMAYQPRYRVMLTPILTPILGIPRYWVSFHRYRILNTRYRCQYRDQYRDDRYRQLQQPISVSISDTISGDTRYRCQCSDGIPISGLESPDIGVNVYDQNRSVRICR